MNVSLLARVRTFAVLVFILVAAVAPVSAQQATLAISDVTVAEGNSGTKLATFTVTLSAAQSSPVLFDIATANGSATAGSDYTAKALTGQRIAIGSVSKPFSVVISGDAVQENDESFLVNISNATGASLADSQAVGTISNDDGQAALPAMTINDSFQFEGTGGTRSIEVSVVLSEVSASPVTFSISTADGTAIAGSDYVATSLSNQTIPAGVRFVYILVPLITDGTPEADEFFYLNVSNAVGATITDSQAYASIGNDDAPAAALSIDDVSAIEGDSGKVLATFTVRFTNPPLSHAGVTFDIATDGGTAASGLDFNAKSLSGQLIPSGEYSKTFTVELKGDSEVEADETFVVNLSNISGTAAGDVQGIGTILNDDSSVGPNISVLDATVVEGNSGDRNIAFTVSVPVPSAQNIGFSLTASALSAASPSDFNAGVLTGLSIPAGQTSTQVMLPVHGDTAIEGHESFKVQLSAITGANPLRTQAYGRVANDDDIILVSVPSDGTVTAANYNSATADMSPDGRYIAFESLDDVMDRDCQDGKCWAQSHYEVYLRDMHTGINQRVSATPDGSHPNNQSYKPVVSADGRYVAFESYATDLVVGEGQVYRQNVYVRDMQTGLLSRVSIGYDGSLANDASSEPAVSADGRFVAFTSQASNLVPGVASPGSRAYVRDLQAGTTHLVASAVSSTHRPQISSDGRYVAFESSMRLTPDDNDGKNDVYVADRVNGALTLATVAGFGVWPDGYAGGSSLSADGRRVAFSASHQLSTGQLEGNIFVRDLDAGTTTKVLRAADGVSKPNTSFNGGSRLAPDGKSVIFVSGSTNLTNDPVVSDQGVFVRDLASGTTRRVTHEILSRGRNIGANRPMLSGDSSLAVFDSDNNNMVVDDTHGMTNVFRAPVPAAPSVPTMSISDASVSEGNAGTKQLSFTVSLSSASASPAGFEIYSFDGSAEDGNDFVAPSAQAISIPAGLTSTVVTITILGDTYVESDEAFSLKLVNVSGATTADGTAIGTIGNDDAGGGGLTLSVGDITLVERASMSNQKATFTARLSAVSPTDVTFNMATVDASAVSFYPQDYSEATLTAVTIPAGQLSKSFEVTVWSDEEVEPDEYFIVKLSNLQGATIADVVARGTILDEGSVALPPTLSVKDIFLSEGNSGTTLATFTAVLSSAATSVVAFDIATADGTATAGSDYVATALSGQTIAVGQSSQTFSVAINGDTTVEPVETFNVLVSNVSNATVTDDAAIATISSDDVAAGPTLSIADVSFTEGNAGTKTATFTVMLSVAQPGPVLFDVATANGTAASGSDYVAKALTGQRIAIGATSKLFAVTINGDTVIEPNESFTVNLSNATGADIADSQATGTITNDDVAATPTVSIADASVVEGNSGTKTVTFTVSVSPTASGTVSYDIATSNGTAVAGSDYLASALTGQSVSAGSASNTFVVTINGDASNEADETFTVNVSNVVGANLGDGNAVGTITNDDAGGTGPSLSIADVSLTEGRLGSKLATFTVSLSASSASAVTFNIATADGTAVAPTDYTAKSLAAQVIAAGATSKTFTVAVRGDTVPEANEVFFVNVSGVVGATVGDGQATGTITNDDAGAVSVARFDTGGLFDDIDDGHGEPVLGASDYATLLLDTAKKLCVRTGAATVVGVDSVENLAVLRELADAVNGLCAGKSNYHAVMPYARGAEATGFLVEAGNSDADRIQVQAAPSPGRESAITALTLRVPGYERPLSVLLPAPLPTNASARTAQLTALAQRVRSDLMADPEAHLVLIGGVTVPGLVDMTTRYWPKSADSKSHGASVPAQRVLLSPSMLRELGATRVEFSAPLVNEAPSQVLQLQR